MVMIMDTFNRCRLASEKVAWVFDEALSDLSFDHDKRFLPSMLCGKQLPSWMSRTESRTLNQIRGYSYAHIFECVEEFILWQTCQTATGYVHRDIDAVSAVLNFASEEAKHQRMFMLVKQLLEQDFGFRPGELPDKEGVARAVCANSPFAVYLLTLTIEWLTQRHYVECFSEEEASLDLGFVRIFRLHWTEEAQHARLDALELEALANAMSSEELEAAVDEYVALLFSLKGLLATQDELDLQSLETALGKPFEADKRAELLRAMNKEYLWTFIVSGLEHKAFQLTYNKLVPERMGSVLELSARLGASLSTDALPAGSAAGDGPSAPEPGSDADQTGSGVGTPATLGLALVIDDQGHVCDFAASALGHLGFDVLTAASGEEGLRLFEAHHATLSVVLLDMTMPGMSGAEALVLMTTVDPSVPVVLSSGHMREDALSTVHGGEFAGYLQKPYLMEDLAKAVSAALACSVDAAGPHS